MASTRAWSSLMWTTRAWRDYWTYHDQPAGQAGTGSVNDYTGNLVFASPLMSETGEKVPLDYHIVYNGYHSGTHFENGQKGDIYGWGWQSNLSQRIDPADSSLESNYKYVFLDEDGTKHYFITDPNNSSRIIDENGLGMELTTGGPSDEYYTIKYKDGSKKTFTGSGYLRKIYDNENNSLTLQYYGTFLNQVTDGAGRTISIEYASSGAVTTVRRPDGKEIKLHYIGGNLATVTYPDGTQAQFAYDSSNRLTKATNIDGTSVQYAYYSAGTPMVGNRVQSAAEYSSSGAVGNTVKFTYNADNTTTFTYCKAGAERRRRPERNL